MACRDVFALPSELCRAILEGAAVNEVNVALCGLLLAQCARPSSRRLHPSAHQDRDSRPTKLVCGGPDCAAVMAVFEGTTRCYRRRAGESGCWMHSYHHSRPLWLPSDRRRRVEESGCWMHRHHHSRSLWLLSDRRRRAEESSCWMHRYHYSLPLLLHSDRRRRAEESGCWMHRYHHSQALSLRSDRRRRAGESGC